MAGPVRRGLDTVQCDPVVLGALLTWSGQYWPDAERPARARWVEALVAWPGVQLADRAHPSRPPRKPALQQVVAIGLAWIAPDGAVQRIGALGTPDSREAELLRQFFQFVGDQRPRLVGWNSGRFDLPVLTNRAVRWEIPAPGFYAVDAYRGRYDEVAHRPHGPARFLRGRPAAGPGRTGRRARPAGQAARHRQRRVGVVAGGRRGGHPPLQCA
ncbi:MAG: 3'-5' exonuclease [Firmicutes bacterium]|nr:hypothetical protein [Alicyclobacillaceae bacterium]MCL6498105.1 3'-5' exonuclease [Bacillota bacterium]